MDTENLNELDFTENAWEAFYDTVDSTCFREQYANLNYHTKGTTDYGE